MLKTLQTYLIFQNYKIVNINKQHLNFIKKTIQEIIRQSWFLSNYTDIYMGKQKLNNKIIKNILKRNKNNKFYYPRWKLIKDKKYLYKDNTNYHLKKIYKF